MKNKKILLFILIIAICIIVYKNLVKEKTIEVYNEKSISLEEIVLADAEKEMAEINKWYIYGTHLNIFADISIDEKIENTVNDVKFILSNGENNIEYAAEYSIENGILSANISNEINDGINLDEIEIGEYILLLKVKYQEAEVLNEKYYSLYNETEYDDTVYYTIIKNDSNNKIGIDFSEYNVEDNSIAYLGINVKECTLEESVYDIVIDPGHGGNDSGAISGEYYESELTLEISLKLKEKLEDLGLKVLLTREDNEERVDAYGEDGRAVIPNKVSAKYCFSIHLNSNESSLKSGGVEIYAPSNASLSFARLFADNIVEYTGTCYSSQNTNKEENGVYVWTFSESDIKESEEYARENSFESYNITTDTPYLYMIREIGGIVTNAYVDGRNKIYGINKYYNLNQVAEAYLLELGYISVYEDLNNLINDQESYAEAITQSIKEYLNIK